MWPVLGTCAKMKNKDIFHPTCRANAKAHHRQREKAVAICLWCPVRVQCLNFAFGTGQRTGIWGGIDMGRPLDEGILTAEHMRQQA
ncbi:WhiB family transcriptional regulator [Rhodococcus sp. BH5]|uniref:WhiB family transcriptional regulator n=1 Tax=Rhodococcus sp. BH5 TaxID=2871702 RepID=UPI003FA7882B